MTQGSSQKIELKNYQPAADLLAGRNILITGAGDGIGRALAVGFARHGATVILLGRRVKYLESVYDEIENAGGPQPAIYPLDLAKAGAAQFDQLGEVLGQNFPQLHGLVHNASILGPHSPMTLIDEQMWQQVLQINLTAPFLITRACYPLLNNTPAASLLFTSDAVAAHGRAYWGAYGVAKAGQDNLMQIIADEWENNTDIRVNSIDPGPVHTKLRRLAFPGEDPDTVAGPDDVLAPYLYLIDGQGHRLRGSRWQWQGDSQTLSEF